MRSEEKPYTSCAAARLATRSLSCRRCPQGSARRSRTRQFWSVAGCICRARCTSTAASSATGTTSCTSTRTERRRGRRR
eukprot:11205586-Heterocapsa_arctica.AAC.1